MENRIIFIHGFADISRSWHRLRSLVNGLGYDISFFEYKTFQNKPDLVSITDQLASYIDRNGFDDFVLMGHSQGGLIAEWYDLMLKPQATIRKIVTIATPYHGLFAPFLTNSRLVSMMPIGRAQLRQLAFCSPTIKQLVKARAFRSSRTPYVAIVGVARTFFGSESDGIVPVLSANRNATYYWSAHGAGSRPTHDTSTTLLFVRKNHLPASFLYGINQSESEFRKAIGKSLSDNEKNTKMPIRSTGLIIPHEDVNSYKSMRYKARFTWSPDRQYIAIFGDLNTLGPLAAAQRITLNPGQLSYRLPMDINFFA